MNDLFDPMHRLVHVDSLVAYVTQRTRQINLRIGKVINITQHKIVIRGIEFDRQLDMWVTRSTTSNVNYSKRVVVLSREQFQKEQLEILDNIKTAK